MDLKRCDRRSMSCMPCADTTRYSILCTPTSGAYHAYRAVVVERHTLPKASDLAQLTTALRGSSEAAAAAAAVAARGLCTHPLRLHATVLLGDASLGSTVADLGLTLEQQLQPALGALSGGAVVSSSVARFPPPLPAEQLRWDAQRQAHMLPAVAATAWVHRLQQAAHAASQMSAQPAAAVLVYEPPARHHPLLLELPGGSVVSSMPLRDSSLLLVANHGVNSSSSGATSHPGLQAGDGWEAPAAILSWLLQPLESLAAHSTESTGTGPGTDTVEQLQQALAAACAADAAASAQRFVDGAAAAPSQPVTAASSRQAAQLMRLLQDAVPSGAASQQRQGTEPLSLTAALGAWAVAQELPQDAATGAHPAFPPEHSLAVLMPLALPLTLVLAQALGRELGAARRGQKRQRPATDGDAAAVPAVGAPAPRPSAG